MEDILTELDILIFDIECDEYTLDGVLRELRELKEKYNGKI